MKNRQVPSPNAYDFYLDACGMIVGGEESCPGGCACEDCDQEPRELTSEEKAAIVGRNSAALQRLREGFAYESLSPTDAILPPAETNKFMGCRRLAKLLHMESEVLSAKGDPAGAMGSLLDAVHLGSDLPRGGLIIDALMGYAMELIGVVHAWPIIDQLDADSARELAHRAEAISRWSWPFAETMEDEKRWGLSYLNQILPHRFWKLTLSAACAGGERWFALFRALLRVLPLSRSAVLADFEQHADEHIALARMPYPLANQQPAPTGNYVSRSFLTFGAQSATQVTVGNSFTQKAFLAAALALRAYQCDHGAYPGELSDLVPEYLGAVPNDPFAEDAPLRYRIEGDRYILYSIGPDGADDGGKAIFDPNLTFAPGAQYRVHPNSENDIVAGVNW